MSDRSLLPLNTHYKRRNPLNNISNSVHSEHYKQFKHKRTKIKQPLMTAAVLSNMDFNESNNDLIQQNKIKKQNQVKLIQSNIWENQKVLTDLKIKYDDYQSKITVSKRNLELIQLKISSLENYKLQKTESLEQDLFKFKQELQKKMDKNITSMNLKYEKLAVEAIEMKQNEYKSKEKLLLNQIQILKNTIHEEYSEEKLNERKKAEEEQLDSELKLFEDSENEKIESLKKELLMGQDKIGHLAEQISTSETNITSVLVPALKNLETKVEELNLELKDLQKKEIDLNNRMQHLDTLNREESNKLLTLKEQSRTYQNEITNFYEQIKSEEQYRRFLHEKLQELKGNIRVFCRIKPDDPDKTFSYNIQSLVDLKESLVIEETKTSGIINSTQTVKSHVFSFDKIFDKTCSNGDIFQEISQLVQSSLDGFNVCIFTYGQTGSGKTFTMSNLNDGLIPRSLSLMFEQVDVNSTSGFKLYGQFFEIYGETVKDLIRNTSFASSSNENEVEIENPELSEINIVQLNSLSQINNLLIHTNKKRATAATMSNDVSSRSHSVFKVYITKFNKLLNKQTIISTLNLIDLAGSERLNRSKVTGERLKETLAINKSLSSLGDVISSLKSNSNHVPYRNSKLTYLLRDSLGGNSKTLMFVNISCLNSHLNESLSSLRFANKVNETILK